MDQVSNYNRIPMTYVRGQSLFSYKILLRWNYGELISKQQTTAVS